MNDFILSEIFKLELRWDEVIYEKPGICKLINAYFTGPVLQIAQKINDDDFMMLDFYSQYIHLVKNVYVAKFIWGKIEYSQDGKKVFLSDAFIVHDKELNRVPTLNSKDYFIIDTSNHTSDKHGKNLVYKTYVINPDNSLYRFSNDK